MDLVEEMLMFDEQEVGEEEWVSRSGMEWALRSVWRDMRVSRARQPLTDRSRVVHVSSVSRIDSLSD